MDMDGVSQICVGNGHDLANLGWPLRLSFNDVLSMDIMFQVHVGHESYLSSLCRTRTSMLLLRSVLDMGTILYL